MWSLCQKTTAPWRIWDPGNGIVFVVVLLAFTIVVIDLIHEYAMSMGFRLGPKHSQVHEFPVVGWITI